MYSPLEQFAVLILQPVVFFGLDFSITNATIYLFVIFAIFYVLSYFSFYNVMVIPSAWVIIFNELYVFVSTLVKQQTNKNLNEFVSIVFSTFIFILVVNLVGLLPFGYAVTGHIIVTFVMAFSFNLGFFLWGFQMHGIGFLRLFVPKDAPMAFKPLIVVIEIVSYLLRTFSLSIRLFANMMAGHTLLHILASFCFASGLVFSIVPWALVIAISFLEIAIAFIQAYVFSILLCIYANDSISGGHD
jgi:ATP synthase subunit 6